MEQQKKKAAFTPSDSPGPCGVLISFYGNREGGEPRDHGDRCYKDHRPQRFIYSCTLRGYDITMELRHTAADMLQGTSQRP